MKGYLAYMRQWPLVSDFRNAISILDPLYNAASIHVVYENDPHLGQWNLYTSVAYGREADMRSVPPTLEVVPYGRFTVARQRLDRSTATTFITEARGGLARLDSYEIAFELANEIVEGFRPSGSFSTMIQKSPFNTSLWTREHIGIAKRVGTRSLEKSEIWNLADDLTFLKEARWSPILLHAYLEKLGDLDEWWPSPVKIHSRNPPGALQIELTRNVLPPRLNSNLSVRATTLASGLETGEATLIGPGPYPPLLTDAEGSELTVYFDGIAMHRTAGYYVRRVATRLGIMTPEIWTVHPVNGRPAATFPVGAAHQQIAYTGAIEQSSIRRNAWAIGDYSRSHGISEDAERVYDPGNNKNAIAAAFGDLRSFGSGEFQPRIRIADPWILDEAALETIAISALRDGRPLLIELYCEFKSPPKTSRKQAKAEAERVARRIKSRLGVSVICYRVQRLHDRFLIIGERLWHVGASFNKLGEEFSAIIEMRDPRRIGQVVAYLDRYAVTANEEFRT